MILLSLQKKITRPLILLIRRTYNQSVIINDDDGIRNITLNDEKTKNSLSLNMMNNLIEALNAKKEDISLRAIVLSAKGNVFSAGHNLKELQVSDGIEQHKLIFRKATELMQSIIQNPVPVIAKVNGFATAAGCQLVATCDMIICSDTSKFSTPGANFGIFCSTPGIAIGRSVPKSRAMYMLLTGKPISAQEAYDSGLVTKVVSAEKLDDEVNGFATAAGCQLVATCDMIICSDTSKFSTPGANFGIFCSTPGIAIGRSVPKSRAMYMLLTGKPISAQEAYDSGLVTKVVSAEKLDDEVLNIIEYWK